MYLPIARHRLKEMRCDVLKVEVRRARGLMEACSASYSLCSKLAHILLVKAGHGSMLSIGVGQGKILLLRREGGREGGKGMNNY